jgi:hypothetical protein
MSYTYTSWLRSLAIVVTQLTSTRPATEGSLGADKSCIVAESVVAKSKSRTGLPTIVAEQRQLNMGKRVRLGIAAMAGRTHDRMDKRTTNPDQLDGTAHRQTNTREPEHDHTRTKQHHPE